VDYRTAMGEETDPRQMRLTMVVGLAKTWEPPAVRSEQTDRGSSAASNFLTSACRLAMRRTPIPRDTDNVRRRRRHYAQAPGRGYDNSF